MCEWGRECLSGTWSELMSSWCLSSLSIRCLSSDSLAPRRVSSSMVRLWSWRRYSEISSWEPRIASWLDLAASDRRSMRTAGVQNKKEKLNIQKPRFFFFSFHSTDLCSCQIRFVILGLFGSPFLHRWERE